jgi:hypothetical protein
MTLLVKERLVAKGGFSFFLKEGWKYFYWGASGTLERAFYRG